MKELADIRHFMKFLSVGVVGMIIDNIILVVLTAYTPVFVLLGKLISAEASITVMFLLNDNWTFKGDGKGSVWHRFIRSNSVRFVGLAVGTATFYILYTLNLHLVIANVIGIGTGFCFNYMFENLWTWKKVSINEVKEQLWTLKE